MRWWTILLLGGVSYVLFILAYLPASHAFYWLLPEDSTFTAEETQGTLWSGSAGRTFYRGIELGSSNWTFDLLALPLGRIQFNIRLNDGKRTIEGNTAYRPISGDYLLTDLQGSIAATRLPRLIDQPLVDLGGEFTLNIERMGFTTAQVTDAMGRILWNDAEIQKPFNGKLGTLQFDLSGDEELLLCRIENIGGTLMVDGSVEFLPDGRYSIDGSVKPMEGADPGISGLLRNFGQVQTDGAVRIAHSGRLDL